MLKGYKDHHIIKLIKDNHQSGCKELIASYGAAIYGIIFRIVNDEALANELLKNTIYKLCNDIKCNKLNMLCVFTHLMQIARNLAKAHQQKLATKPLKPIHLNTILDLIVNKGLSLIETAKIMNLSLAEVSSGLRVELKRKQNNIS
ncbi:MAG: hypothetical protein V4546_08465 [Bacteroidota bacterium]